MDGNHSHSHSDPDLKIFAICVLGICAIVFGPAIMAALWIMALCAGIGMGAAAIGLVAVIAHNLRTKQPPQLPPPAWMHPDPRYIQGRHTMYYGQPQSQPKVIRPCTLHYQHSELECNGYHRDIPQIKR